MFVAVVQRVLSSYEDRSQCCDRVCEAPVSLAAEYSVDEGCVPGSDYSVSECPIGCSDGNALDGAQPPQICDDDGAFSLPTCVASESNDFPWVLLLPLTASLAAYLLLILACSFT